MEAASGKAAGVPENLRTIYGLLHGEVSRVGTEPGPTVLLPGSEVVYDDISLDVASLQLPCSLESQSESASLLSMFELRCLYFSSNRIMSL